MSITNIEQLKLSLLSHRVKPVAPQSSEASPHSVKLGGQSLSSDYAGQHVLAVQAHVVLNARLSSGEVHGPDGLDHALVHALGPAKSWFWRSLRLRPTWPGARPEGMSLQAATEGAFRADFALPALLLAELSGERTDRDVLQFV